MPERIVGKSLCVAGWVKTSRQQSLGAYEPWAFLELNGSTLANLQVLTCDVNSNTCMYWRHDGQEPVRGWLGEDRSPAGLGRI